MINETTLLYYFSASFQGMAALLGLLGVFAIFRLQQLGGKSDGVRVILFADRGHSTWPQAIEKFEKMSCAEKKAHIANIEKQTPNSSAVPLMRTWAEAEQAVIVLRKSMWMPVAFLATIMLFNIWCLPYSGKIADVTSCIWFVVGDLLLSSIAVIWNLWAVYTLVNETAR